MSPPSTHRSPGKRSRYASALVLALIFLGTRGPSPLCAQQADVLTTATDLVRTGRYDQAITQIEATRHARGADARLLTVEGIAYSLKGDDTQALTALREALKQTPSFPGALRAEAEILTRRHDPAAIPVLQQIVRMEPHSGTAHEMLGLAQASAGDCSAAVQEFQVAGEGIQEHPESLAEDAACLSTLGRYPEALAHFDRLRSMRPEDKNLAYDFALTEMQAGRNDAAAATLQPLLNEAPDTETLLLASDVYENLGNTPRAAALARQAIVAAPSHADAYVQFAELCMAHESYQAGVDMVTAGLSRMPHNPSLYLARGLLYGGMAEYDKAEADFRANERFDPHHGTGAYGAGLVQAQRNSPEQAMATVRAALRQHPDDGQLQYLLARLLIEQGASPASPAMKEAVDSAKAAVRLAPQLVLAHDLLAKIYMDAGQQTLAMEQCRAALVLDPADHTAMYRLMRLLRETGDTAAAQALGKQVADTLQKSRQDESTRLRYRIEGASADKHDSSPIAAPAQPRP